MAAPHQDHPAGRAEKYFTERDEDLDRMAGGFKIIGMRRFLTVLLIYSPFQVDFCE